MNNRITYLKQAAAFFLRNSRNYIAPKGIYQNIKYYLIFPYAFINYMVNTNKDWSYVKLDYDKEKDTHI